MLEVRVRETPAEPDPFAISHARDVDEPGLQVADDDAERLEVLEQVPDARPMLGARRLQACSLARIRAAIVSQAVVERLVRVVGAPALQREVEERAADQRQQGSRLLDGLGRFIGHGSAMVAC